MALLEIKVNIIGEATPLKITEYEVVLIKKACLPNKILNEKMGLKLEALRAQYHRLEQKMGVENRQSLIIMAIKLGIVRAEDIEFRQFEIVKPEDSNERA